MILRTSTADRIFATIVHLYCDGCHSQYYYYCFRQYKYQVVLHYHSTRYLPLHTGWTQSRCHGVTVRNSAVPQPPLQRYCQRHRDRECQWFRGL